jgi:hypothetical protein
MGTEPFHGLFSDRGYYMHAGGHGALPGDYDIFLKFIKMHFMAGK